MPETSSAEEGIRRTLASYCQTCDDGRFDEFAALFAREASFQVGDESPVVGREAIAAFMERAQPPGRRGKHLCGEPLISLDGDVAVVATDFVFVGRVGETGWSVVAAGRYDDRLVSESGGGWLFASRTINLL
jgi:3-phenylpropionate/cinnamic acid dioxygenase small subunit